MFVVERTNVLHSGPKFLELGLYISLHRLYLKQQCNYNVTLVLIVFLHRRSWKFSSSTDSYCSRRSLCMCHDNNIGFGYFQMSAEVETVSFMPPVILHKVILTTWTKLKGHSFSRWNIGPPASISVSIIIIKSVLIFTFSLSV